MLKALSLIPIMMENSETLVNFIRRRFFAGMLYNRWHHLRTQLVFAGSSLSGRIVLYHCQCPTPLLNANKRRIRAGYSPNSFFEAKVGA